LKMRTGAPLSVVVEKSPMRCRALGHVRLNL
jgi:hypothetical protein